MLIIILGIVLVLLGAAGIYTGYSGENTALAAGGWGALIVGALVTLFGFGKRSSDTIKEPDREIADHGQTEIRALVQSMGVVAVADQKIRDQEIQTIAHIHEQMLGITISEADVREILSEFDNHFDITKRLSRDRAQISPMMKRLIVQSCHLVMVSDLEIVRPEENRIREIGLALGFDQTDIDDLIASAGT
ncbi:MAG: TerB family tellurite resistance protein [Pseudomonadota bacterium]